MPRLAVFVSPHGFGHAARASAVAEALARRVRDLELELWTTVPEWFFARSLSVPFRYRRCRCDVGLVQSDAVTEDLPATAAALEELWGAGGGTETEDFLLKATALGRRGSPVGVVAARDVGFETKDVPLKGPGGGRGALRSAGSPAPGVGARTRGSRRESVADGRGSSGLGRGTAPVAAAEAGEGSLAEVAAALGASGATAVLCDISPFGLLAARLAGLPSILLENFTWDWIYEGLVAAEPRLAPWVSRLRPLFASATLRLQASPVCQPVSASHVLRLSPVARRARQVRAEVRSRLGIAPGRAMVLVSLGGIHSPEALRPLVERARLDAVDFVVPGGAEREQRRGNLVLLPHRTPVYHPDLVAAADAVVGKLGYSTVAEAFAAGSRYAFVPRPSFRESAVLEAFVRESLPAVELTPEELAGGAWTERLPELLARPRPDPGSANGAGQAAAAIAELL